MTSIKGQKFIVVSHISPPNFGPETQKQQEIRLKRSEYLENMRRWSQITPEEIVEVKEEENREELDKLLQNYTKEQQQCSALANVK